MAREVEQRPLTEVVKIPYHPFRKFRGPNENDQNTVFNGEPGGMATAKRMIALFPLYEMMRKSKVIKTQATATEYVDKMQVYISKVQERDTEALAVRSFTADLLPLPEDGQQNSDEHNAVVVTQSVLSALLYSNMLRLDLPSGEFLDPNRKIALEEAISQAVASYPEEESYRVMEYTDDPNVREEKIIVEKRVSSNSPATRVLAAILMHDFNRDYLTAEPRTLEDSVVDLANGAVQKGTEVFSAVIRSRFGSTN